MKITENKVAHKVGILALLSMIVLDIMSYHIILPMMPAILKHLWPVNGHVSPFWADLAYGVGISAFPFAVLWGAPLMGYLSDRFGRKRVLMVCLLGQILSASLMLIAIHISSFMVLVLARVMYGLSTSSNIPVIQSVFMDWSRGSQKARGQYLSWVALALTLGMSIGPFMGGIFGDRALSALNVPFLILGGLAFLMGLALPYLQISDQPAVDPAVDQRLRYHHEMTWLDFWKPIAWPVAVYALLEIAWSLYFLSSPIHLMESGGYTAYSAGLWCAWVGLCMSFSLLMYPTWGRWPLRLQIQSGLVVAFGFMLISAWAGTDTLFLFTSGMVATTIPISYVAISTWVVERSSPQHYGVVMGICKTAMSLAWMLSGMFSRLTYHFHVQAPYFMGAFLLGLVLLTMLFIAFYHNAKSTPSAI